jgi:aryl sulfotransferase
VPEEKGIYWLASYPKSGNTWFRIFLAHVLDTSGKAKQLNEIKTGAIASARLWVDEALGFDSADLTHDELDKLRPAVYRFHARKADEVAYHKVHDAYTYCSDFNPLIPIEGTLGAIYFIRHPLDVVVSLANHLNCSVDKAIVVMGSKEYAFCGGDTKQYRQLRQRVLSWSKHVLSWSHAKDINCLMLRYEDMKAAPMKTFKKAVNFLKLNVDDAAIQRALRDSDIKRLQSLEARDGFLEKPATSSAFFRKGIVGDWKNVLTPKQVNQVIADHGEVMAIYGYDVS